MRILVAIPHFFREESPDSTNRSRRTGAKDERLGALIATVASLHQLFGPTVYGLDHERAVAWHAKPTRACDLDIVICTTGRDHLLSGLKAMRPLFRHHASTADPLMLGFECHKLLSAAHGHYDYYAYIEDDIVVTDPLFFRKRWLFDRHFGPQALLQPNRYEVSPDGPIQKIYVDYRIRRGLTAPYQDIDESARLQMHFADELIQFERPTYPSAGCFILNSDQLELWINSPHYLDGDVSYMSPGDSAVTLSVMKAFRIYKPVLSQAWFLEVLHASPRWIDMAARDIPHKPLEKQLI